MHTLSFYMSKKSVDGALAIGSEVWNVAEGYTKIKILRLMIQLDRYETIAKFGTEEFNMDMGMDDETIKKNRIDGLNRFFFTLRQLIDNVIFIIRKKDLDKITEFQEQLQTVEENIIKIYDSEENEVTHEVKIEIDEVYFNKVMMILRRIKKDVNSPINNAGLIFKESEEMDIDAIMNDIIEGG